MVRASPRRGSAKTVAEVESSVRLLRRVQALPGVPRPGDSRVVRRKEQLGLRMLGFETEIPAGEIGLFYLYYLGEEWMLIESKPLTSMVQGWSGLFLSADLTERLFIYALPRDLTAAGAGALTNVTLITVPRPGG